MIFHPSFTIAREHRLLFEKAGPSPAPEGAPAPELTPERQKAKEVADALKEKLRGELKNPNVIRELIALKFDEAETDEKKFQETYHSALEKAANAYFKTLEGTEEEKAQKVNELFQSAGAPDVRLEGGALQMAPSSPEKKERVLTPEEQAMIDTAFSTHPQLKAAAERLMITLKPGSPELETARGFFEAFNGKKPEQKKAILTDNHAFQQFLGELPADQKEFVSKLRVAMQETGKELSDEEMQDTVEKAQNFLKEKKFDYATATDIQKNLMLAQLQMFGIDVSGGEAILKDPSKLQALNGSPMERGFNKILGMISYILLSIQQMKERIKPSEKKPDAPAGDKGKKGPEAASGAPGEPELKKQVKEKDMQQVRMERQNEIDQNNKLLDGDPSAAAGRKEKLGLRGREVALKTKDARLQAKSEQLQTQLKTINKESSPADYAAKEREISDNEAERKKIAPELDEIQKQKTVIEARNAQLTTEIKSLEDIQKRTEALRQKITDTQIEMKGALATPPIAERAEAKAILAALNGFKITLNPAQADEHFTVELQGIPDSATIDRAKFAAAVEAVRTVGGDSTAWELEGERTLKKPEAFSTALRQTLEKLKTKPETRVD